jgi:hypothetical protein
VLATDAWYSGAAILLFPSARLMSNAKIASFKKKNCLDITNTLFPAL